MGGERAGAVVTDSPYGINREGIENDDPEGLRGLFDGCLAAMPIDNAVIINFQSPRLFPVWLDALRAAGHKFERALWMHKINDVTNAWRQWMMNGEPIIFEEDGNLLDGQHRLMAAMKRREITELPCIVFRFKDVAQEARAFLAINTRRKAVSAIDKHRIGGRGGDEEILRANAVLQRAGVSVAKDPKGSDQTKAIVAVKNAIKCSGEDAVVSVLTILRQVEWSSGIPSTTIRVLCYLRKNLDGGVDARFVSRLIAMGGDQIQAAENKGAALGGSHGERVRSIGLIEAVNKGLQNRYRFKGEQ
jgi:hypothetical protein